MPIELLLTIVFANDNYSHLVVQSLPCVDVKEAYNRASTVIDQKRYASGERHSRQHALRIDPADSFGAALGRCPIGTNGHGRGGHDHGRSGWRVGACRRGIGRCDALAHADAVQRCGDVNDPYDRAAQWRWKGLRGRRDYPSGSMGSAGVGRATDHWPKKRRAGLSCPGYRGFDCWGHDGVLGRRELGHGTGAGLLRAALFLRRSFLDKASHADRGHWFAIKDTAELLVRVRWPRH